jgi:hypothetical protein
MTKRLSARLGALTLTLFIIDILFFGNIDPVSTPSIVLFLGFLLLATSVLVGYFWFFRLARAITGYPKRHIRTPVIIASTISIFLLALESVGQLTLRDAIAISLLCLGVYFYVRRYLPDQRA